MYLVLKYTHVVTAILSISGFLLRGYWMMNNSEMLLKRWVRILPHIVDTVFLMAGIGMIVTARLRLAENDWLLVKIGALVAYVLLGAIALKRGRTMQIRSTAFVFAILTFTYIAGVAFSKSPGSWLALVRVA